MSGILFWLILAVVFVLLWWAGFYATKDMRVKKNAMREEQAKRNLKLYAQQQAEAAATEADATKPATESVDDANTTNETICNETNSSEKTSSKDSN